MFFLLVSFSIIVCVSPNEYGYLPNCPNGTAPAVITKGGMDEASFVVLEVHKPATGGSAGYLHRRRFRFSRAAQAIGADPEVDFRGRKTAVYLDGYMNSAHMPTGRFIVGNLAAAGYNVIGVDTQKLYSVAFPVSVRVTWQVGNHTAQLLADLMRHGLRPADIELVGISLGGQVASLVAKHFQRITGRKVGRIYALDPGGPCFRGFPASRHLNPEDADFVQAIHTGSDGFGMADAMGHVDFYFNGGEWQHFLNTDQPVVEDLYSHVMSVIYFYSSILLFPDKFVGIKCTSVQQAREHRCYENEYPYETNVMGFKARKDKPGIYYVPVRGQAPLYAEDGWMEKKIVYPLVYNDAMSDVEHFVLEKRVNDLNLAPLGEGESMLGSVLNLLRTFG